jgi:hypothetical protein
VAAVAVLVVGAGCSSPDGAVAHGRWGGRNAELVVTSAGATARFKCGAGGSIEDVLTVDESSSFDAAGVYVTPVVNSGVQPARYVGSVSGSDMTLALVVSGQPAGTFQLHLGAEPVFDVCNF